MDKPIKRKRRAGKRDMTIGEAKQRKAKEGVTKKEFEKLLTKAAQPVSEWTHGQEDSGTSESRLSDGYNDKRKNQDKTEGKED